MGEELEQLGERIAEQAAHFDAAMHRLLTDLREFDQRGGWHKQGAKSCAHWLAWRVGWDLVTARQRVNVACKLTDFPQIDDALRRGEISYSRTRAILRVATAANEAMLLEHARLTTASQLERISRQYARLLEHGRESTPRDDEQRRYVRRRDTEDGMVKIEAVLHPEEAELVWAMLDHAAAQVVREAAPAANAPPPAVDHTAVHHAAVDRGIVDRAAVDHTALHHTAVDHAAVDHAAVDHAAVVLVPDSVCKQGTQDQRGYAGVWMGRQPRQLQCYHRASPRR